jgi:hypothetical protein
VEILTKTPCRRASGSERAWFLTREEAEAFALDPANIHYHGDLAHLCAFCDLWHLSKPEWLESQLTPQDAQLLEDAGVAGPRRLDEYFRCVECGAVQRDGIEFLILQNGEIHCAENCGTATARA